MIAEIPLITPPIAEYGNPGNGSSLLWPSMQVPPGKLFATSIKIHLRAERNYNYDMDFKIYDSSSVTQGNFLLHWADLVVGSPAQWPFRTLRRTPAGASHT
jgi:hypothetical protein